ncbi:MAG: zinc-binding protein [Chloroflexi bacterium]|nr:MAG: zinc-binding protein [Chloroflexota bacterium]
MSFEDRTLTCQDCGQPFTFTADDQQYHREKGYTNEPKRCPSCRQNRRSSNYGGGGGYGSSGGGYGGRREMHDAVCAQCGKDTQVPFRPSGDRPVYCSDCFSKQPSSPRRY